VHHQEDDMARTPKKSQEDDMISETASTLEKMLRETVENKPYMAIAIAFGIGWLWGRVHRPF
jgi:ElaB/YqjD/DUF883 family membrane-anchored ribosome-binding protein